MFARAHVNAWCVSECARMCVCVYVNGSVCLCVPVCARMCVCVYVNGSGTARCLNPV